MTKCARESAASARSRTGLREELFREAVLLSCSGNREWPQIVCALPPLRPGAARPRAMSALGAMLPPGLPPLPPPAAAFWALAPGPSGLDSQFVTMLRAATFLAGIWLFGRIMATLKLPNSIGGLRSVLSRLR